jgi:hypothetical protein
MGAPLPHPFAGFPARARRGSLLVFAALSLAMLLVLASLAASLRTPDAPNGNVSFELAGDRETAERILAGWGDAGRARAARSLRLDFWFLASYAPALALLCAGAADRERALGSRLAGAGVVLSWGQLAAGGLDASENLALLRVLDTPTPGAWPALAAACAWLKFFLVSAGLLYAIASGIRSRIHGRRAS